MSLQRSLHVLFAILVIMVGSMAFAQSCPTLVDSPVLSSSVDDIPTAENSNIKTYAGSYAQWHPNHVIAFLQTGANEQKVWFSVDIGFSNSLPLPVYYNRRYRADSSSPWYWEFSYSKAVTSYATFVTSVLYSSTAKYVDPTHTAHKYVMYSIWQPPACFTQTDPTQNSFGILMSAFSDNGTCWSQMYQVTRNGGATVACMPSLGDNLIEAESVSAIDGGDTIYFVWMEGNLNTILNGNLDQPYVQWGTISPSAATAVTASTTSTPTACLWSAFFQQYFASSCGLFNPVVHPTSDPDPDRFRVYAYAFNLSTAWDAANGDLYLTRGYPYPYDRHAVQTGSPGIPASYQQVETVSYNMYYGDDENVSGCGGGAVAGLPNRNQTYKMHIGTLSNFSQIHTGTWTLVLDNGNSRGYETDFGTGGVGYALVSGQSSGTRDAGAASFLRDSAGFLVRSGTATIFTGSTAHESLSQGPCVNTGNERNVAVTIP
jgi:hypothetical protein